MARCRVHDHARRFVNNQQVGVFVDDGERNIFRGERAWLRGRELERHEVARRFEDHKTLLHPELGAIELDCQALFTEDQSQCLLVLTAAPRTEAAEKLALLSVLGTQSFAAATLRE